MRTINEILQLASTRKKPGKLHGAVFSPGEDTILALEKVSALLPVEFTIYSDPAHGTRAAIEEIESRLGNACHEFNQVDDLARELSGSLLEQRPETNVPFDFAVRGDQLQLADAYRAITLASPVEDASGATPDALHPESVPRRSFLSHVALIDAPSQGRVLAVSDGFVHPRPDVRTRLSIIKNGVKVCEAIGIDRPRVALLAAVEQVYPGMSVTVESAEIARMSRDGAITGAHVDGPLSFDVALVEQVAKEKGAGGEVAGRADLLVGSSIEVVNGIYMAQTVLARAKAASVVTGSKVPLALPFPSDCVDNIFFSVCLACLLAIQGL